jgi:hypothetical protein
VDDRIGFIEWLHGETPGYIFLGAKVVNSNQWIERAFDPKDEDGISKFIISKQGTGNIYFCPTRVHSRSRIKENIVFAECLWADLDECSTDLLRVKPSILVQTSNGRHQAYWKLVRKYHALDVEEYTRRIAYTHESDGCDISGWDLTQMMRVPNTFNYKYMPTRHKVSIVDLNTDAKYELTDFDIDYPPIERFTSIAPLPLPTSDKLPDIGGKELLEQLMMTVNPRVWSLFKQEPNADWSSNLWNLQMMLFEVGVKKEEVYIIIRDAACNEFARDGHDDLILWREVLRAEAAAKQPASKKYGDPSQKLLIPNRDLLTDEERKSANEDITIVDEYIKWGKSVCDAPPQYHVAGAFILLTSLLSGVIRLPITFANLVPNLWFMILAETTLTRKSTAMDLAIDLLMDIEGNIVLATDGTVEGIMQSMQVRTGMPSVFFRDEFSGLLEAMTKKDYLAGLLEGFTKLYDGKLFKRTLRRETIEIKDPIFILFAGGIRERIYSLLTHHHINSGFIPRFCFITGETDFNRLKPLGPPSETNVEDRNKILQSLLDIRASHTSMLTSQTLFDTSYKEASLTPEAWRRFNEIDLQMKEIGLNSSIEDALTPVMTRLAISGLKASILIAASRIRISDCNIIIDERDIIKAFSFVEQWKEHAIQVVSNSGKTQLEKILEKVYTVVIQAGEEGVARSVLMLRFKMSAKEADVTFNTLIQRGLIIEEKRQRAMHYYAKEMV